MTWRRNRNTTHMCNDRPGSRALNRAHHLLRLVAVANEHASDIRGGVQDHLGEVWRGSACANSSYRTPLYAPRTALNAPLSSLLSPRCSLLAPRCSLLAPRSAALTLLHNLIWHLVVRRQIPCDGHETSLACAPHALAARRPSGYFHDVVDAPSGGHGEHSLARARHVSEYTRQRPLSDTHLVPLGVHRVVDRPDCVLARRGVE